MTPFLTIRSALMQARQQGLPALEARMLMECVLKQTPAWLVAHDNEALSEAEATAYQTLCQRRLGGEPLAYILGWREFYGRQFKVNPAVLIPRPETELLVDLALEKLTAKFRSAQPFHVLDLGTGSGAIAITLALEAAARNLPVVVSASDISASALAVARQNAMTLGANINFIESHWWQAIPKQSFDLILSNPPYIEANDPHLNQGDLRFEPAHALTDQADGLSAYRALCAGLGAYLAPGGWVLFEHGYDQAAAVQALLQAQNLQSVQTWPDLAGIPRISGGQSACE
nr:peptide chain release factor N(5)-glutamine methyltransferase [Parvibium lacunae]